MTEKAILKDKTTAHVRALLMSAPVPLTVNELKRDYFTFIGEQLRFRDMGYTTLEDFLRDIEHAVHIGWKNGMMMLSSKADEATQHIQSLVSRQKIDPKKKYAVLRNRSALRNQRPLSGAQHRSYRPPPPAPLVSAYVLGQIKQLLRCHTDGLPLTHFNNVFSKKFGQSLNFRRFGFGSLIELLYSLRDVVRLQELQGGEWWVKAATPPGQAIPPLMPEEPRSQGHVSRSVSMEEQPSHKRPSKGRGRRRENSGDVNTKSVGSAGSHSSLGENEPCQDTETKPKMEIRKILEKHPEGLWARQLLAEYTALFKKPLDFQHLGFVSVIDFVTQYPDIVRLDRPNPKSDWLLFDARLPVPEDVSKPRERNPSGAALEETKDMIQKVLETRPHGIPVSDFSAVFQELTGSKLPVTELGFKTHEELFISLADTVLQLVYRGAGGFLVFPADADVDDEKMEETEEIPQEISDRPHDVVGPGCHYTPILSPEPGGYVEIFVSNISSPSLFWLQLRKKSATLALENLMDNLDAVYNHGSSREYIIPDSLIVPGQVCACIFPEDQNWHRGVITGTTAEGFIQVYYVDYGNTNSVDKDSIRFLKLEFLKLPAQALQARLANIVPKAKKWKPSTKARLLQLCVNKPLIAYVYAAVDQILSVCLTDTNSNEDIHINDLLVHEGYAIFCPDTNETLHSAHLHQQEVPDYGCVYGWTSGTEAPRLPAVAKDSNQEDSTTKTESCYVKWVQLTQDDSIHLVNLDGVAYIMSAEISSLIWDEDILSSMLKKKHVDASKVIVTSDDHPKLFEELHRYKVKSLTTELHGRKQFVSLYTLNSVPNILRVFEHPSSDLIQGIEELDARFDPKSPYWKSGSGDNVEDSKEEKLEDIIDSIPSLEEKHIALQALQFRRKRILQMLMSDPSKTVQIVNELNNCEVEIRLIKEEIDNLSQNDSVTSQTPVPVPTVQTNLVTASTSDESIKDDISASINPVPVSVSTADITETPRKPETENEKYVKNILASATKPIAAANIVTKPSTSVQTSQPCTQSFVNNLGNNPMYRYQQMTAASQTAGSTQAQLNQLLMQQRLPNMNHLGVNAGNQMTGSTTGNQGMNPYLMQQRMVQPMMITSQGMVPAAMNMQQYPGQYQGLLPGMNQLGYQTMNNMGDAQMQGVSHMQMSGLAASLQPGMGRGQPIRPGNMGLLPGLYPLLQNLSMGRGSLGSNNKK